MKRALEKISCQIQAHGFLKGVSYFVFAVIPMAFGCGVLKIYRYNRRENNLEISPDQSFVIVESLEKLKQICLNSIIAYKGPKVLRRFEKLFLKKQYCSVGRIKNEAGCICWIKPLSRHPLLKGKLGFLVRDCFSVPNFRGKGLYPGTLQSACKFILDKNPEAEILIECTIFNYSSLAGIEKAGFCKARFALLLFGARIYF